LTPKEISQGYSRLLPAVLIKLTPADAAAHRLSRRAGQIAGRLDQQIEG